MRDPDYRPLGDGRRRTLRPPRPEEPPDITRDAKAFTAAIRTRIFTFLRAWAIGDHEAALEPRSTRPPTAAAQAVDAGAAARARSRPTASSTTGLRLDPEARNLRHTHVEPSDDGGAWRVQQVLVDPELNDWMAEFEVDLAASRERANRC